MRSWFQDLHGCLKCISTSSSTLELLMDRLPIELVEAIALHLSTKDAKSLSQTCRLCHAGCQRKIWSYPEFVEVDGYAHLRASDIMHLPIKGLYSGDLCDFETCSLHDLPPTLQELYITEASETEETITRFWNSKIKICIYLDALKGYRKNVPNIYEIVRCMQNVKVITGRNEWYGVRLDLLREMSGIPFKALDIRQIYHVWYSQKGLLIDMLTTFDIERIYMNRLANSSRDLVFNYMDMSRLRYTNIVEISTEVLSEDIYWVHPWPLLCKIGTLRRIHLAFESEISLWNVKRFPFYGIEIDNRPIVRVGNVVDIREIIEDESAEIQSHSPEWIFKIYFDLVLLLRECRGIKDHLQKKIEA